MKLLNDKIRTQSGNDVLGYIWLRATGRVNRHVMNSVRYEVGDIVGSQVASQVWCCIEDGERYDFT